MSEQTELYPCPFCGGEAHVGYVATDVYVVGCLNVGECIGATQQVKRFNTKKDAADTWNMRNSKFDMTEWSSSDGEFDSVAYKDFIDGFYTDSGNER